MSPRCSLTLPSLRSTSRLSEGLYGREGGGGGGAGEGGGEEEEADEEGRGRGRKGVGGGDGGAFKSLDPS